MRKKHHKSRDQWGMRFFSVDDERGTLSMCKSQRPSKRHKPSVILPLADIKAVHPTDTAKHTFVISCPPIHMTVSAEDAEEMNLWIVQLTLRSRIWRERLNARNPVAVIADGLHTNNHGLASSVSSEPDSASDAANAAPVREVNMQDISRASPISTTLPSPSASDARELVAVNERRSSAVELSPTDDRAASMLQPPLPERSQQLATSVNISV